MRALFLAASLMLAAPAFAEPIKFPDAQYEPVDWTKLDGWANDDHAAAFAAFLTSCRALNGERRPGRETVITEQLKNVCRRAFAAIPLEEDGARKFFEDNFRPLRISKIGDNDGFLTGYYEPIMEGSRVPTGEFTAPLFRRPPNLVASGRRKLGDLFPNKGVKVGRRFGRRKIVPFYTRGEIEDGAAGAGVADGNDGAGVERAGSAERERASGDGGVGGISVGCGKRHGAGSGLDDADETGGEIGDDAGDSEIGVGVASGVGNVEGCRRADDPA